MSTAGNGVFVSAITLEKSLEALAGTAGHLLKIWLVLKHMGLSSTSSVQLDTSNSTDSLKALFSSGSPDGTFFVPFASTPRFMEMKSDASRSIIQTNANRWAVSDSVVTCDPSAFLSFSANNDGTVTVKQTKQYPQGLGLGANGFAAKDGESLSLPLDAMAIWYGRQIEIPFDEAPLKFLVTYFVENLHLDRAELDLIFNRNAGIEIEVSETPLSDSELSILVNNQLNGKRSRTMEIFEESGIEYSKRISKISGDTTVPNWLKTDPVELFKEVFETGAKAILLYGAPRTGKTHAIDQIIRRDSEERITVQIHDGWSYQDLIMGYRPAPDGNWRWEEGALVRAIRTGKKYVVLEEINRTRFSQSIGEVFSLLESSYRGEANSISMPDGSRFYIPEDVVFVATMNNVDRSTEELDDALLGRMTSIHFPPSVAALRTLLKGKHFDSEYEERLVDVFVGINELYPLGHAYFADLSEDQSAESILRHYKTRIRPVLELSMGELHKSDLTQIDNQIDSIFVH